MPSSVGTLLEDEWDGADGYVEMTTQGLPTDPVAIANAWAQSAGSPNLESIRSAGVYVGRNDYPLLAALLSEYWCLDEQMTARVVPDAFSACERPLECLPLDYWIDFFEFGGYTVNGHPADPPAEPLRLYRGSTDEHMRGLSWTEDSDLALWFTRPSYHRLAGKLWVATVDPDSLLTHICKERDGESEFAVDPRDLTIELADET